jgi:signal peptidase I
LSPNPRIHVPKASAMASESKIKQLLFPRLTPVYLLRVFVLAISAYIFFSSICIPVTLKGMSMEPTYRDGSWNFCWKPKFWLRNVKRHDVAFIRLAGPRVMLLKRVVALEGEEVEFRKGNLLVNGREIAEPYIRHQGNWDLPPRLVEKGYVYVVGDNRGTAVSEHYFGQTPIGRVAGGPLW